MKNVLKGFFIICCSFVSIDQLKAQRISRGEHSLAIPVQVLLTQYTPILLPAYLGSTEQLNRFSKDNPYTYIQVLTDRSAQNYHLLYQTDFYGKILFLAVSNNVTWLMNKPDKPLFAFNTCIRKINNSLFAMQNAETAIECIIARLEYCSD